MLNPEKQQAIELILKFNIPNSVGDFTMNQCQIRQCALIACQFIINSNPHGNPINSDAESTLIYWLKVKQEIAIYKF